MNEPYLAFLGLSWKHGWGQSCVAKGEVAVALQEENCHWAKLYVTQALGSLFAQLMHWDHLV